MDWTLLLANQLCLQNYFIYYKNHTHRANTGPGLKTNRPIFKINKITGKLQTSKLTNINDSKQ